MEAAVDLSLEFNSQLVGTDYDDHDLLAFEQGVKEKQPERNPTAIEMIDQSVETGLDAAIASEGGGGEPSELLEPYLGMEFDSLESARLFYYKYADALGFRVRASRFRTSRRDDSVIMRRFVCYREGFHLKKKKSKVSSKERQKRGSLREGCEAMFEIVRNSQDKWVVNKLVIEHTHPFSNVIKACRPRRKKAVPPSFSIDLTLLEAASDDVTGRAFSWGGGEAFGLLEYFKKMQTKNPAFFYCVQVDGDSNSITNVLWADARARIAYSYFGDTVVLDLTYKKNKNMMPFVTFTGTNHHLHPVVFACAVISDETEASFVWLFESLLVAMCGHHPVSIVTEHGEALGAAVVRVFPKTRHRYCKWQILSKCKENLPDLCSTPEAKHLFKRELIKCIDEPETVEEFQSSWEALLQKYKLRDNYWMQSLYHSRQHWATVCLKDTFFAEMSPAQRSESMKKFFQRNFEKKTTLVEFLEKFDQAMMGQYEKEVQADFANLCTGPVLKTGLQIENQAAEVYTKTIFSIFQEEFVQSSSYSCSADQSEDGINWKYHVVQSAAKPYTVMLNYPEKRASCSCHKFEFSGILCRHILRVFSALHVSKVPEEYFLKRWKKTAKSGAILFESSVEFQNNCQRKRTLRCNDLFLDGIKYAADSSTSSEIHNAAKATLQKALTEVVAAKRLHVL